MNLFLNKFLSNAPTIHIPMLSRHRSVYSTNLMGLDKDTFERTETTEVSSKRKSNRPANATKKGECLRKLENITCPYSGVKLITPEKMKEIEEQLSNCETLAGRMGILDGYHRSMQKLEKQVYQVLKCYQMQNPDGSINGCLQQLKPDCLAKLRCAEYKVLDGVEEISEELDEETSGKVKKIIDKARIKIAEDKQDSIFKRKDLLEEIHDITKDHPNQEVVKAMWKKAKELPKSTTNFDAFVVKYANRSPQEIALRLLKPSESSVEHISPITPDVEDAKPGENNLSNFMVAARDWNSGRNSRPLPEFIKEHPDIPRYSQMYINDIIKAIHKGQLKKCDWYPYVIKEKLYNESQGLIDLNIDRYKIDKIKAFRHIPRDIADTYTNLLEENKKIRANKKESYN